MSNEREHFSLSNDINDSMINASERKSVIKTYFISFYFLNRDISLDIQVKVMTFSTPVENIHVEGTMSQIVDLGFSFDLIF